MAGKLYDATIKTNLGPHRTLTYNVAPNEFTVYKSDNILYIAEPTRNGNYTFPNIPVMSGDFAFFEITDETAHVQGIWSICDSTERTIFEYGGVVVKAFFESTDLLTIRCYNKQSGNMICSQVVAYVRPFGDPGTGSRRAFLVFVTAEIENVVYTVPYTIESNPFWFGHQSSQSYSINDLVNPDAYSEDPYDTAPDSGPDGGYGDYDYSGDDINIPSLPSWDIVDSGFVTLYKPTLAQIQSLASYLWTGVFDLTTYKKIFADPMDCIISLSRVPIDANTAGTQSLYVGNINTGLSFDKLQNQFVEVSFKSKNIGLRANGFLDYAPYVKIQIYLPFIGMRALSIDDVAGKSITIKYQVDLFTGACTAYIKCRSENSDGSVNDSVLYQFTGNVIANIPVTQANYSSFIQAVIQAAAKTGSALISGGAAAAGAAAISSGINVAANIKPDIERSGNMTATGGFLGIKKPYLIVTYPNICKPRNREKTVSIPSFVGLGIQSDNSNLKLSDFKGLTILHKINVKKIPCTEVERQIIETQLTTEGVIL